MEVETSSITEKDTRLLKYITHFNQLNQQIQENKAYEPPSLILI